MRETLERVEVRESVTLEHKGQQIFGILHRPALEEKPPVVVILHGFASSKIGSNRCYVNFSEYLAKSGIATFRFDFRGAGDSEGTLTTLTFEDLVEDALFVIENLEAIEGIDARRIAFFGASLGGTIALLAAVRSQKIKTMALWAPVASGELWFHDFLKNHPELIHADPNKILGSFRGVPLNPLFREQFGKMAAYKAFAKIQELPILHMHGEKDKMISMAHQEAFKKARREEEHIRFLTFPQSEHALGYSPDFGKVMEESLHWFQKYL